MDGARPYLEISPDKEIKTYFEKKGINNITNKEELKSFYNHLEDKIAELSDSSDERVKLYFEKREYLKQLERLPSNLSKLEQTVNSGFEGLKVPFRAVMNYVWDAVINQGFEMNDNIFFVEIGRKDKKVSLCKNIKQVYLYIGEKRREKITKINLSKFRRSNNLGIEFRWLLGYEIKYSILTTDETIDELKRFLSNSDKEDINEFTSQMKTILSLPKIMNNYVKWKQENVTKMFNKISEEYEN